MLMCPKCRLQMQQREGKGHYGAKLSLFQCPSCSGLWVDGRVVRGMSYDSALEVEPDVEFEEIISEPRQSDLSCPRCESRLFEQTGEGLPQDLHIDHCTVCEGYWFDKGELMIYKSYLEKKRQRFQRDEEQMRRMSERKGWPRGQTVDPYSSPARRRRITVFGLARDLTNLLSG